MSTVIGKGEKYFLWHALLSTERMELMYDSQTGFQEEPVIMAT